MAKFTYTALDAQGQQTSGVVEAASDADVITQLKAQGLYPTSVVAGGKAAPVAKKKGGAKPKKGKKVKAKAKAKTGKKVPTKSLMVHTRQLATLVHSGLPLLRSLSVLGNQEPNPVMKSTIHAIADSVQSGTTYSEALSQHPVIFNKLFVNMVKAGELGGVLEQVLARLAEYMEKAEKLKNKIVSAAVYPIIVLVMAVLILTLLMVFIIPRFREMFDGMGSELPLLSKIVFGMSDFMIASAVGPIPNAFLIIGGVIFIYFMAKLWGKSKGGKKVLDNLSMKLPLIGSVTLKSSISRFTRTLGTLISSGVPILQALNITKETSDNYIISDAIEKVHDSVKEGETVTQPLQATKIFPDMVISMVDVGEETGQLPDMLLKVADVYEDEVENEVTRLTAMIEPLMIVCLALVVGVIVLALFMPMMQIVNDLQG